MNMLTNPTEDMIILVTNLYNSSCTNTPAQPAQNAPANPFGMGMGMGMGASTMNSGSGASIFGGGNTTTANGTNLFGSSAQTANANPFARNAAGFGAPTQSQASNLFGASTANSNSMNLFGAQSNTNTAGSLFGGSSFSNTNNTSTFGSTNQPTSLFGGAGTGVASGPFSQQTTNASPFALPPANSQTNSMFGGQQQQQQQQTNPVFGGGASFGMQAKTGLFDQANAAMAQTTTSGNIFGQNVQAPAFGAPAQSSLFGNASQDQTQSIFGGVTQQQQQTMQTQDNPFAAVAQSATTNIFGAAQMQQQPQPQQQATPFQSTANTFGANTNMGMGQPLFGVANQTSQMNAAPSPAQAPAQTLQQQQQSIFGTNNFSAQPTQLPFGGNAFQNAQEQPNSQAPMIGGQSQPNSNVFGAATAAAAPIQQSKTLYTPMESLSQDEIDAFNNNTFDLSKIPTKPPPMELCI